MVKMLGEGVLESPKRDREKLGGGKVFSVDLCLLLHGVMVAKFSVRKPIKTFTNFSKSGFITILRDAESNDKCFKTV